MDKDKITEDAKVVNFNQMENCNVFMGDSYGGIFPLPGAQVTINQDLTKQPKKGEGPNSIVEGKVETQEDREARQSRIVEDIVKRFNFTHEQLCYDNKGNRLTDERLATLFGKVFGMRAAHPAPSARPLIEQLWVLLADKRAQCAKRSGEDFYRQTVLNVLGHFVQQRLLTGMPAELANSVFPGTDANEARNISRGVTSSVFPQGTVEHINKYIDKLKNGEF